MLRDGVRRSALVPTSNPLTSASELSECQRFVIAAGIMGAPFWREGGNSGHLNFPCKRFA